MMIQFGKTQMPVITVQSRTDLAEAVRAAREIDHKGHFWKAELLIDIPDRILDASEGRHFYNMIYVRDFRITDPWWNQLRELRKEFGIIIRSGAWFFNITAFTGGQIWDGVGTWNSKEMIRVGWGGQIEI
jgi:hypothetical protein